ncbi:hypothetical protein ACRAWD_12055 [Caulobacter segnis]
MIRPTLHHRRHHPVSPARGRLRPRSGWPGWFGRWRSALLGQEGLVAGDQHVREGQQTLEDVVLDDLVGQVLEEQVGLLLVDVQRYAADLARLSPRSGRWYRSRRRGWY